MDYTTFVQRVVEEGLEACRKSYAGRPDKLKGSVEGFEACRGKSQAELAALLVASKDATRQAQIARAENYWEIRCFEAEVEWVCNVLSAALLNNGEPVIMMPTVRGMAKAASILGVREAS